MIFTFPEIYTVALIRYTAFLKPYNIYDARNIDVLRDKIILLHFPVRNKSFYLVYVSLLCYTSIKYFLIFSSNYVSGKKIVMIFIFN